MSVGIRAMALLTLFPDDQPEAEWTTRDEADIAGWLGRIGVVYEHIDYVPGGFDSAPLAADVEHTHAHAQCYLFREGAGALYLRVAGRVYLLLCTPGDLVIVPAGMRHWLDRGVGAAGAGVAVFRSDGHGSSALTGAVILGPVPSIDGYR